MTHSSLADRPDRWPDPAVFAALDANAPAPISEIRDDAYTVSIAMKRVTVVLRVSRPAQEDGRVIFAVSHDTSDSHAEGDPAKVLGLHVQSGFLADCIDELYSRAAAEAGSSGHEIPADPVIEWLEPALRGAGEIGETFQDAFADAAGLAIVLRLLSLRPQRAPEPAPVQRSPLPKWRLKRALEYIDTHLAEPVTLADIAAITGLSRMYFAAQFRAATGVRPHEFLLRRRIERAQELLSTSGQAVVEVALSVGFQTQAHFTTVFKRFVGETPHRWRTRNRQAV